MMDKPQRKVSFIVQIDADSREALSSALSCLAHDAYTMSVGTAVSGSPDAGYVSSYAEPENGLEHHAYFRELTKHLAEKQQATPGEKQ